MSSKAQVVAAISAARSVAVALPADVPDVPPPPPPATQIFTRIAPLPRAIIMCAVLPDLSGHDMPIGSNPTGDRYTRDQDEVELYGQTKAKPRTIGPTNILRGQVPQTGTPQLTFGVSWSVIVTFTAYNGSVISLPGQAVLASASRFDIVVDITSIPEDWYMVGVSNPPPGWTVLDCAMYVRHGAIAAPSHSMMPVFSASYSHSKRGRFSWAWVPAQYAPIAVPLKPRVYPLGQFTKMSDLVYVEVAPFRRDDVYWPSRTDDSHVWTTAAAQNYNYSDIEKKEQRWPSFDGPRAIGNVSAPLSVRQSARRDSGKIKVVESHRTIVVLGDGEVVTTMGWKHDNVTPPYVNWDSFQQQRAPGSKILVGDWSAVPPAERDPLELWDQVTDARTTAIDPNSTPIGNPPEPSHLKPIVEFTTQTATTDPKRGCIWRSTFAPNDLKRVAVVTKALALPDALPWGCDMGTGEHANIVYVTLSGGANGNRIIACDADNNFAILWSESFLNPTGLRYMDGELYIGSKASKAIWKMDANSRVAAKHIDLTAWFNFNSAFCNLSVAGSDSLFPKGSVATWNWSNNSFGWLVVFDPTGKRIPFGDRENPGYGEPRGTYAPDGMEYLSCGDINGPRILWGTMQDGLHQCSLALPGDLPIAPEVKLGYQEWRDNDMDLVWGDGWPLYGVPLPFNKGRPNVDAWLRNKGHAP